MDGSLASLKSKVDESGASDDMTDGLLSAFMSKDKSERINGLVIQIGANEGEERIINIERTDSFSLGIKSSGIGTRESASAAIGAIDGAIKKVSSQRSELGTMITSFEATANMDISTLAAAESRIRDVDIAKEMTNFTNAAMRQQASIALMAQANAMPRNILYLMGR